MLGMGVPEMAIILVIVTVLFGAKRLPELGRGVGEAMSNFKKATQLGQDEDSTESITDHTPKKD